MTRQSVTVALSGDGGDELFGGYSRHVSAERILNHPALARGTLEKTLIHWIVPVLPRRLRTAMHGFLRLGGACGAPLSPTEIRQLAYVIHDPQKLHYQLAHGSVRMAGRTLDGPELVVKMIKEWLDHVSRMSPSERQQYIDAAGYLPDNILTKVDRASMATSLEVRVPMLDHRVAGFSFRLPSAMKTDTIRAKRVLRNVLKRQIPEALFDRPKRGFDAPVSSWLKGPLKEWAGDTLIQGSVTRHGVLAPRKVRSAYARLQAGKIRRSDFRIVMLAAWSEAHL